MKTKLAIYLAGSIQKGHEKPDETYWTEANMDTLRQHLPQFEVSFLNPAFRQDDLSDQLSVFGRDMLQVYCSDIVFVDARDRRGLGVGAEMMWSKYNNKPLIIWAPKETHYHKTQTTVLGQPVDNFVHPFVESLGDKLVETLEEGAAWIAALQYQSRQHIKTMDNVFMAMEHYKNNQLVNDRPMRDFIRSHELHHVLHELDLPF